MSKNRFWSFFFILFGLLVGWFLYSTTMNEESRFPFRLGLDLSGGTHLVYRADTSNVTDGDIKGAMAGLRDVIERRVNLFGVGEPIVQTETGRGEGGVEENRLVIELPGITDVNRAIAVIGETPVLEFKVERPDGETQRIIDRINAGENVTEDPYLPTALTGRYLKRSLVQYDQTSLTPSVSLEFDREGSDLFGSITKENIGKTVAIYLDGAPISVPTVREEIRDGKAQITGSFSVDEAKTLVGRLNSGALPVGIKLLSTQVIGASLGADVATKNIDAGIFGTALVAIFLLLWYRLPGFLSIIALSIYIMLNLAIFKFIPVTLTAAGIAGFVLSIGMAVDANILIFERIKEEMRSGRSIDSAIRDGFARAWLSIRDSNVSSMITAFILFWMGTSMVKGFALTFGIGVVTSMFTAITVTRNFLYALHIKDNAVGKFLMSNGFTKI